MSNLLSVKATALLSIFFSGIALPAARQMDISEGVAPETLKQSRRERAAVKIVTCINSCTNHLQILTVARMIQQFEEKYDAGLPLRRFLMSKSFELTHYPNNA